ncbi:MAG: phytanoyl-CoA dioxygenase family protein [Pseudomonadota bacterium]|nr:phytanoyl-CoA dioxygenase family protein [Pseudomonadota bacterium]
MPKILSAEQVASWHSDGCIFPIRAVDPDQAERNLARYFALEKEIGEEPQNRFKIKAHLPFPWMWDIICNDNILDAVEDIIGPNILCWGSSFFTKNAHDRRFVSWHQDSTYYGLSERATVSVWYAFSRSNAESGCMRFIPGTHDKGLYEHDETGTANNLLMKGQTIHHVEEDRAVDVTLEPGEFSIHHEAVVHGSNPNKADYPRIGISIHYIAPHVHQVLLKNATATLVRGTDKEGHWAEDPEPKEEFDKTCLEALDATYGEYLTGVGKH